MLQFFQDMNARLARRIYFWIQSILGSNTENGNLETLVEGLNGYSYNRKRPLSGYRIDNAYDL